MGRGITNARLGAWCSRAIDNVFPALLPHVWVGSGVLVGRVVAGELASPSSSVEEDGEPIVLINPVVVSRSDDEDE